MSRLVYTFFFFFFNDTATTEIYTLSLHDALPISKAAGDEEHRDRMEAQVREPHEQAFAGAARDRRSEEHTSELQSPCNLVCRLLLEKKKKIHVNTPEAIIIESSNILLRCQ